MINLGLICFAIIVACTCIKNSSDVMNNGFGGKNKTDTLRGVAIIMIVYSHICQFEKTFAEIVIGGHFVKSVIYCWGAIGVSLFFILSGFGCFHSIMNQPKGMFIIKHGLKILVHFSVAFVFICGIREYYNSSLNLGIIVKSYLELELPEVTTWYIKIQLLMYIFLFVAFVNNRIPALTVSLLSLLYSLLAWSRGVPAFWWKTSLCFSAGCGLAMGHAFFDNIKWKNGLLMTAICMFLGGYCWIIKYPNAGYLGQIFPFLCLSIGGFIIWDYIGGSNTLLETVGKASIDCYLIHIGIVDIVFETNKSISNKMVIFISAVLVGTTITYYISNQVYKQVLIYVEKGYNRIYGCIK